MDIQYKELVELVKENPLELERWKVFSDLLQGKGDPRGELIALDCALRNNEIADEEERVKAHANVLDSRIKVLDTYLRAADADSFKTRDYFLQDQFWMGSFPLRFPNKDRLKELDGSFVTEEFPHYELLPRTSTYALGVHQLRRQCEAEEKSSQPTFPRGNNQTMYRPFTFRENIVARVEDFYTLYDKNGTKRNLKDRLRLFNHWLDSCTGIAYKADSPKFKIIPQSPHLIGINEDFNQEAITEDLTKGPLEYDSLAGIELDRNRGIYDQLLTQEQVLDHPPWNAAIEDDKPLLKEYTNIVFSQRQGNNMGFWLRNNVEEDQLRALFVGILSSYSYADGSSYLSSSGSFLAR